MAKEKLLLIDAHQLEALTDAEMWCRYLKDDYEITHVGFDMKRPLSPELSHVHRRMVPTCFPKLIRGGLFLLVSLLSILFHRGKIMVVYFDKCILLKKVFPKRRMLLDIRTLTVFKDESLNAKYDSQIKKACDIYDEVSVISDGVAKKINLENYHLLPLGANCISNSPKIYDGGMRLLYVGTLRGRNIEVTIKGLSLFLDKHSCYPIKYTIIGDGEIEDVQTIDNCIRDNKLDDTVNYVGRVPHHQLKPFFDEANIGVSFVPLLPHYQYQPPTKTFEYLMSGLFCIATCTSSNSEIITESQNGVLLDDTPAAFCESLEKYLKQSSKIDQKNIEKSVSCFRWDMIVNNYLKEILKEI